MESATTGRSLCLGLAVHCWAAFLTHRSEGVTNCLPKFAQPGATKAMQEICNPEDRAHAEKAIEAFARVYGTKWRKAVAEISDDREELLAFRDFPAEHWVHLRRRTPSSRRSPRMSCAPRSPAGRGSPAAALAMVFKLVESAQARWRAITGAHLVPLVREGAKFESGVLVERGTVAA
ncbi:transposase [Streptomyces sp. NPDC048604]|uniref:transposase n=1 Tax=Streptomyces sp. NPDC048604 TaxID=3365578 RepID=UPI00371E49C4